MEKKVQRGEEGGWGKEREGGEEERLVGIVLVLVLVVDLVDLVDLVHLVQGVLVVVELVVDVP